MFTMKRFGLSYPGNRNRVVSSRSPSTLWVDVDDLIHYLAQQSRPSGIQRVTFEIGQALYRLDGGSGRVRFLRRAGGPRDIVTVDWEHLDAMFRQIANPMVKAEPSDAELLKAARATKPALGPVNAGVSGVMSTQQVLMAALTTQGQALLALARLPILTGTHAKGFVQRRLRAGGAARRQARQQAVVSEARIGMSNGTFLKEAATAGDSFLVLGSPWSHRDYIQTVRWARDELRLRFVLLMYDLVPLRHPEWCDRGVISSFVDWHKTVLPLADQIFTISHATANDVVAWAQETGLSFANKVQPIPMGTGLGLTAQRAVAAGPRPRGLPTPGSYVLFVSTLEARKNHALLFRVWRRLLSELPRNQVPTLVFAGRVGWLVSDLLQQIENTDWLDGKIRLLRDPTDAELMALYRGCRFTLFPSLFEGWGLPVSESLALGCPCISSNRTSLPEAGGDLARYFDPEDVDGAYRAILAVIKDPADLEAWRQRVAREFRHVPWADSAKVIRGVLDALDALEEVY